MELRLIIGYGLTLLLLGALAMLWALWRRQVRKDRMMRWGTPYGPGHARRRGKF